MSEEKWVMPEWMKALMEVTGQFEEFACTAMMKRINDPASLGKRELEIIAMIDMLQQLHTRGLIRVEALVPQEETWLDAVLQTAQQNVIRTLNEMGLARNAKWFKKYMDMLDSVDERTPEDHHTISTLGRSFTVTRGHLDDGVPKHTTHDYCASEVIMHFPFLSELVWLCVTHPEGNFSVEWGNLDSFTRVEIKPL